MKKVTSDYTITAVKKLFLIASGVAVTALLARYLGPELRAEYAVIVNASAITVVLLNFGVSNAYQSARRQHGFQVVQAFVAHSLLLFGALCVLALLGLGFLDSTPAAIVLVASLSLLRMQVQSYSLIESIRGSAYVSIVGGAVELLTIATLWLFFPTNLFLVLVALLAKESTIATLSIMLIASTYRSSRTDMGSPGRLFDRAWADVAARRNVSLFRSFPLFALTVLIVANYRIDVLFLDLLGVDKSQIGIFAVGVGVSEHLWIISDIFKDVQISRTARGSAADDVAAANRAAVALTAVAYLLFLALGKIAIVMFFGADFADSFQVAALMLIANIFMIPCKILGTFYISLDRINVYLAGMAAAVALNVTLNLVLIPRFGLNGAIVASILSYFVAGVVLIADFVRHTGVSLVDVILIRRRDIDMIDRKLRPHRHRVSSKAPADLPRT